MSWYMAVIVRGSFTEEGYDRVRMGDLLYKLVEAPDAESAYEKAVALGEKAIDNYRDEEGTEVHLRYIGLADLMEIAGGPPGDGAEVYSQAIHSRPMERILEKDALTVFQPWEVPEADDELEEAVEMGEIAEPGAERFRPPPRDE
jgi:hypothetical protein